MTTSNIKESIDRDIHKVWKTIEYTKDGFPAITNITVVEPRMSVESLIWKTVI